MTPGPPPGIRALGPDEWKVLRATRLRALRESPGAYLSTYEEVVGDDEDAWRRRFVGADWVVATDRDLVVGLAGLISTSLKGGDRYVEWVWVAPGYRRNGVLRALLGVLTEIGHAAGLDALWLWVVGDNHVALRAYTGFGFRRTGRKQTLVSGTVRKIERQLKLELDVRI